MFKAWYFQASRSISSEITSDTTKNFRVHAIKTKPPIDHTSQLIKASAHRISSMTINFKGVLLNNLERKPAQFSILTSLDLDSVTFSTETLLLLAPQLLNLRLAHMKNHFDISSVDNESKAFSKLKNIKFNNVVIDMKTILTKCCHTLESLDLHPLTLSDALDEELTSLKCLSIYPEPEDSHHFMSNLLSKCSGSLRTMRLEIPYVKGIDFSTLLKENMKITTLEIVYQRCNIEKFLNKCPLIQHLYLKYFWSELPGVVLNDLLKLVLVECESSFMYSFLKNVPSLKTLHLSNSNTYLYTLGEIDISVIPKLDTVWISNRAEIGHVLKLFPRNVKVMFNFKN